MKVITIIVDKLPKNCEECAFGHIKAYSCDEPCNLVGNVAVADNFCPLVLEEDYTNLNKTKQN